MLKVLVTSSRAEVFSVTNPNEEERMRLAFSQSVDDSAIELRTIMAVEKVLRKVRAFTCLVTGNRAEADEIVEDALILYLSTDPDPDEADVSYRYLISAVRRLMRTTGNRARRGTDLEPELMPLLDLPIERREIAALHLGAGLGVDEVSMLLDMPTGDVLLELSEVRRVIGSETFDEASRRI